MRSTRSLQQADVPAEPIEIPYEGTTHPGVPRPAPGLENEVRPTIIVGGGWDSTMVENHLGMGRGRARRGYHVMLLDGPGQGRLLIDEGLPLRHDWEQVVTPVVDAALRLDGVDPDALVYWPWEPGRLLCATGRGPRAPARRIVADPGQIDVGGKLRRMLGMFGLDRRLAGLPSSIA